MAYGSMTDTPAVIKARDFNIDLRSIGGVFVYSLVVVLVLSYLLIPHYDVELRKGKVEVYLRSVGDRYEAKVVYHGRCFGSCIDRILVNGEVVYTGSSYAYTNDKQIVTLTIPLNSLGSSC